MLSSEKLNASVEKAKRTRARKKEYRLDRFLADIKTSLIDSVIGFVKQNPNKSYFESGEVNVAVRLEAAGDVGGILMSYETYAHVQDMVEVEEKESVKMKGINREIKVFSVLKRRTSKQRKKIVSSKDKINKASYDHKIKEIKNDLFSLQKKIYLLTKEKGK